MLDEYHTERGSRGAAVAVSRKPSENVYVNKVKVIHTAAPPPDSKDSPTPKSPDLAALECVIIMLEKVLLERSTATQANSTRQPRSKPSRIEGLNNLPCAVCGDATHSALTHCCNKKLCFKCFSPDHSRRSCPVQMTSTPSAQLGNLMDLHPGEDGADPLSVPPMSNIEDFESVFESVCSSLPLNKTVIFQGTDRIHKSDILFYTTVTAAGVSLETIIEGVIWSRLKLHMMWKYKCMIEKWLSRCL